MKSQEAPFSGMDGNPILGNDIKKNTDECIRVIEETIFEIKTMDDYTEE